MRKSSAANSRNVTWDTISVPLSAGVDLRSGNYLREPTKMRRLLNAQFSERKELSKRDGHVSYPLESTLADYPEPLPTLSKPLLCIPGNGVFSEETNAIDDQRVYPCADGGFVRDDQLIAWTGDRLLVKSGDSVWQGSGVWQGVQKGLGIPALFCTADVEKLTVPTAVVDFSSAAVGLSTRCFAHDNGSGAVTVKVTTLGGDSLIATHSLVGTIDRVKVITLGGGFAVVYSTPGDTTVRFVHISETNPLTMSSPQALGSYTGVASDWCLTKRSDNLAALFYLKTGITLRLTYFNKNGPNGDIAAPDTALATAVAPTARVAASINPLTGNIGVFWGTGASTASGRIYIEDGSTVIANVNSISMAYGLTATYRLRGKNTAEEFVVFGTTDGANTSTVTSYSLSVTTAWTSTIHNAKVVGEAFTYGNIPLVTVRTGFELPLYTNRVYPMDVTFAVEENLKRVVSATGRGSSGPPATFAYPTNSIDFLPGQNSLVRPKWSTQALTFLSFSSGGRVYETSISGVVLDFSPELVSAGAGRSTYLAGAIVSQWDGSTLAEAGFLSPPMYFDTADTNPGGGSLSAGVYRYRVYAVKRNRWGEISRSPAFTSEPITAAANDSVTLHLASIPWTNDDTVYFEVYRTLVGGTAYHLVSGQIPDLAVKNDKTVVQVNITDDMSDADAALLPLDPHNPAPNQAVELEESSPPGCRVIANAFDRLWFAGGEVPAGQVAMSKFFEVNESVAWNDIGVLLYQPDRGTRPVTAIQPLENAVAIFRDDAVFLVAGDGPDNLGNGVFSPARRVPADLGAHSQNTTIQCPYGIVYWTNEGPRLLGNNFQVVPIGDDVATEAKKEDAISAIQVPGVTQIRFYRKNGPALVWDYMSGEWSTFTNLGCVQALYWSHSKSAAVFKEHGAVWVETPGLYLDAGIPYEMLIRTADLSLSELKQGSHRVRRWAIIGRILGDLQLTATVFLDGSPVYSDRDEWDVSEYMETRPFMSDGTMGNSETAWNDGANTTSKDGVFRARKRLTKQTCNTVSLEFTDNFAANGGFVVAELALELGTKPGLRRLPKMNFTKVY